MAASFCGQLKAMLWRNILLKQRNKKQLLQELLFPVFFVLIMAMIMGLMKPKTFPAIPSFPEHPLSNNRFHFSTSKKLLVSPDTPEVNSVMSVLSSLLDGVPYDVFDNQSAAEEEYKTDPNDVAAGIIFNFTGTNLSYAIRLPYESLPSVDHMFTEGFTQGECRANSNGTASGKYCQANHYLFSGFVWLQNAVDTALIRQYNSTFPMPSVSVQLMPKEKYNHSITGIQIATSIFFILAYSFFLNFLCVILVSEKEKKIREGMKIMGLRDSVWWLSWAIVYTLIILVVTIIIIVIAMAASFFANSNLFILFLLLFLYGLSIINMAFLMTPFFTNAYLAGVVGGFATLIISLLYFSVIMTREATSTGFDYAIPPAGRWALCLLSPVALALAMDQAIYLDVAKGGMLFSTITEGDFPLYGTIAMLAIDIFLYLILAVYLDHVIPGEYGPRYKAWFCFRSSYWFKKKKEIDSESTHLMKNQEAVHVHIDNMEPVSEDLAGKAGIRIINISKEFKCRGTTVKAVNELSLNMYEGQITAILGHNGAGKTTLINMLCGLSPPSLGTATIEGMDVSDSGDMERIRAMTGVCPQHDILYDELSCREHLLVFAGIKGVPDKDKSKLVEQAMKDADIADHADVFSKNLSGGQKRKLSVAIALIGNPKILFLDEPTAGMDPYSRRHLWSLLKNNKEGKIILLTTHFMDEADILADRKAIISHGKLRCCGSSLFLKNKYGIGYHLNMVVEPDCDADKVTDLLKKHVSHVEMKRSHAKELAFMMPMEEVTTFSEMFSELETPVGDGKSLAGSLGIVSYGVSMNSLEEVFLKIGEEEEASKAANGDQIEDDKSRVHIKLLTPTKNSGGEINVAIQPGQQNGQGDMVCLNEGVGITCHRDMVCLNEGVSITCQRFWALLKIRFLLRIRNPMALVFQILLPIILVIIGCILNKLSKTAVISNPKPLTIKPFYILPNEVPLLAVDTADTPVSNQFIDGFKDVFDVDKINASVKIADLSKHWMGFNLINLKTNSNATYTALYNDTAIHSLPAVINLMSNALFAFSQNKTEKNASNLPSISVSSLVWPSVGELKLDYDKMIFTAGLILAMAFVLITPLFAVEIVQDRQLKTRSQLRVSGITFNMYWTTSFLFHLTLYFLPAVVCIITVIAAQIPSFSTGGAICALVLVFITYSPANLLLAYVFSFAFDKYESCQAVLPNIFTYVGFLPYILISLLDTLGHSGVAEKLHYLFTFIDPPYIIFGGVYYIDRVSRVAEIMKESITFDMYFKWSNNILISILVSVVHFEIFYILLRVLDIHSTGGDVSDAVKCGKSKVQDVPEENNDIVEDEDENVIEERHRVASFKDSKDKIPVAYVENLRKEFKKREKSSGKSCKKDDKDDVKVVVRNATFAVDGGEVLGLLGPNGAGKTTTLNMIIAETAATRGKVIVDGHNVISSMSEAFQALGYCPQHDALWDTITLREHLECYAAIKGIPKRDIDSVVRYYIDSLKLHDHAGKGAKKLSGGTRRKVSYAISMLGNPKIVLLDEPSTGMDPQSKRFLWDTISSSFQSTGRGAILTTHYMEEADALCSRVVIMVNGQLQCLGSTQHLKDKFGSGYLLEVKLHITDGDVEQQMDELESHIASLFPHVEVLERFGERGQYKISKIDVTSLSKSFSALEEMKISHKVEDYSFSQTTLEQVFLEFAKKQHEEGVDPLDVKNIQCSPRHLSKEPQVVDL